MSRVGKLPVIITDKVKIDIKGQEITVKGVKGELKTVINSNAKIAFTDGAVHVEPANDTKNARAMWGTARAVINNMVKGVTEGFVIRIEIVGVGFRAAIDKNILNLSLGYSHDIKYMIPEGIEIKAEKPTLIVISGADKQVVGQVAAELHRLRRVDPYKGKGVLYEGKKIRRKEGKKK
ncbi:MAG: 50S ribosomal protein L6 [Pseudomonadota bacterium]